MPYLCLLSAQSLLSGLTVLHFHYDRAQALKDYGKQRIKEIMMLRVSSKPSQVANPVKSQADFQTEVVSSWQ